MSAAAAILFAMPAMSQSPSCEKTDSQVCTASSCPLDLLSPEPGVDRSALPVLSTPSGLRYRVVREGSGKTPTPISNIKAHYEGRRLDGSLFDSSYQRGEPLSFPINKVIQGWIEGLQLMKVGAVYEFYIPSQLAYGDRDLGVIAPNSDLLFKIELIAVE